MHEINFCPNVILFLFFYSNLSSNYNNFGQCTECVHVCWLNAEVFTHSMRGSRLWNTIIHARANEWGAIIQRSDYIFYLYIYFITYIKISHNAQFQKY